jgi:FSR family fosmidomycin resistance protein-like MFS transporter
MQVLPQANRGVASTALPTMYGVLFAISFVHLLNDSMQAVIPAVFPILEKSMGLSYTQVGLIAFALQMTSSVMQPVVGYLTDKKPSPYLLPLGMASSLLGMLGLAFAPSFGWVLLAVLFVGLGSAVFHPEGSRVAYLAAGPRRGFAQSIYQVGGNSGASLAPLMTALIFVPLGQKGAVWFTSFAALAILVLLYVSRWYREQLALRSLPDKKKKGAAEAAAMQKRVLTAVLLLIFLVFARSWYGSGLANYYQFYLIESYGLTISEAQVLLFIYMAAGVLGTLIGGPLSDRFGKRRMILFSMLGAAPFALILPHVSLFWAYPLLFLIGMILSSSFSVTVVYAQELIPGRVGMVSGLIVGLAFGMGAIGAVALGKLADLNGLSFIMMFCSCLPLIGVLTWFLPGDDKLRKWAEES